MAEERRRGGRGDCRGRGSRRRSDGRIGLREDDREGYRRRSDGGARNDDRGTPRRTHASVRDDQRSQSAASQPTMTYLSRDDIRRLANVDSNDIIKLIATNEAGFLKAYQHPKNLEHPLALKHLIKILYKLIKSGEVDYKTRILARIFSIDGTYALFMYHLNRLIQNMTTEANPSFMSENVQYLDYLLDIGIFVMECIPTNAIDTFPHLTIKDTINRLECSEQLVKKMEHLSSMVSSARTKPKPKSPVAMAAVQPPEDFRSKDVLPQPSEINSMQVKPFLRPNITQGPYTDWEHYLDIQYRLLREDFIGPLRSGICSFNQGDNFSDIRVYTNVHVVDPVCLKSGLGFQLKFDTSGALKNVQWEHSKRLIYGSLLCLSHDNFHNIIFVTVVDRDPAMLAQGFVIVKFEGRLDNLVLNPETEYIMVESTAYFEAYRHILEGLKTIVSTSMPFRDYIVSCNVQKTLSPCYLRAGTNPHFNLAGVLGLRTATKPISILDCATWPHWNVTDLDESQLHALRTALGQEVSLIQGPPGTGKTFIGLKIVEALLLNRMIWDPNKSSPILVVCYTNHALDQFLEGIKAMKVGGKAPDVVRIGGRCKSEKLKECVLSNRVHQCSEDRSFPKGIHKPWIEAKNNLDEQKNIMDSIIMQMNKSSENIFELSELSDVISKVHANQLQNSSEAGKEISVWLGLWFPSGHLQPAVSSPATTEAPDNMELGAKNEDQWVTVDEEARLLEDDRMSDEEELYLPPVKNSTVKEFKRARSSASKDGWTVVQMDDRTRQKRIRDGLSNRPLTAQEAGAIKDLQLLPNKQRWMLYRYWMLKFRQAKQDHLCTLATKYDEICEQYTDAYQERNLFVLRQVDVIGMTTTGASKHHYLRQKISSKIVIVEEAAEVFEAHIITSLSPSVQQLIMIGDHQQLKPNPNNYMLEKEYNFNVSLFERLINNKMPFITLQTQHRMRPEIATLITPHIYPVLCNAKNVLKYEHIKGIGEDVFLVDHSYFEEHRSGEDMYSHTNVHEASYAVGLCHHLLKQGYKPCQITMLTTYRGQLLEMKRRMKRADFEGVRVAVVDDYQGEENDIILLSLVRSNAEHNIGFLKSSNRICVSLSRAKKGFYVIGNFSMLRDKDGTVWPKILVSMEQRQCVGRALPLYCQNHPKIITWIEKAEDFSKCPEGGCSQMCDGRLKCGHTCMRLCHPNDRDHVEYKCHMKCNKLLTCTHKCLFKCFQCAEKCRPCSTLVPRQLKCGHTIEVMCSKDPVTEPCTEQCTVLLPCGHLCQAKCSQPHTPHCNAPVLKELPCGHKVMDVCYHTPNDIICTEACSTKLDCDHPCSGTCAQCHSGRLHVQCSAPCNRTLPCGHICNFPCTSNCPPCSQQCANCCNHSKCPKKCYESCSSCTEDCPWQCEHFKCTKRCDELCDRLPCNMPCKKILKKCTHPCIGLCGEDCPSLCRVCDFNTVTEIFFGEEDKPDARFVQLQDCKHIFEVNALDQWMEENSTGQVQFKTCPKCKTIIRCHLRYGNIVKNTLRDMQSIKEKQLVVGVGEIKHQLQTSFSKIQGTKNWLCIQEAVDGMFKRLENVDKIFPQHINAIQNQIVLIPLIVKLHDMIDELKCERLQCGSCNISIRQLIDEVQVLQAAATQFILLDQQLHEVHNELRRLLCLVKLCDLKFKLCAKQCVMTPSDEMMLSSLIAFAQASGINKCPVLTEDNEKQVGTTIAQLSARYNVGGISDAERIAIVQAIGLTKGHWFKCPNGHFYCIGECGGAMQVAKCPECGQRIGGQSHALEAGNQLASEMDGALYPAWSNAANMEN